MARRLGAEERAAREYARLYGYEHAERQVERGDMARGCKPMGRPRVYSATGAKRDKLQWRPRTSAGRQPITDTRDASIPAQNIARLRAILG